VIDRFTLGSLGMVSLEAIACGRPAIAYVSAEYEISKDFPLKNVRTEEDIAASILQADAKLWEKQNHYLEKEHNAQSVVRRLLKIYDQATGS